MSRVGAGVPDVCELCGRDIVWAVTPAGKRMPLDPERLDEDDARGNVGVRRDHHGRVLARVLSAAEPLRAGEWRAVPHFATCPNYQRPSRARGGARPVAGATVVPMRPRTTRVRGRW